MNQNHTKPLDIFTGRFPAYQQQCLPTFIIIEAQKYICHMLVSCTTMLSSTGLLVSLEFLYNKKHHGHNFHITDDIKDCHAPGGQGDSSVENKTEGSRTGV